MELSRKELKVDEVADKINFLGELDVELYLLFMHYVPGETEQDRMEQNAQIARLGHRHQNPACIPFPGTPYFEKIIKAGFDLEKVECEEFDARNVGGGLLNIVKEYSKLMGTKL